jgi:cytochrome c oxidase subunit 2
MKKITILSVSLVLFLFLTGAGCVLQKSTPETTNDENLPKVSDMNIDNDYVSPDTPVSSDNVQTEPTEEPTIDQPVSEPSAEPTQAPRIIEITAKQFEFVPGEIHTNVGETITLKITSIDVAHSFAIPQLGIDEKLFPNQTTEVTLTPDKAGRFSFFCSVYCGAGHSDMRGILVVN